MTRSRVAALADVIYFRFAVSSHDSPAQTHVAFDHPLFPLGATEHETQFKTGGTFGNGSVFYGGAFGVTANAPMRIAFTRIPTPEPPGLNAW